MKRMILGVLSVVALFSMAAAGPNDSDWVQLLRPNDSTLSDWIIKIQGQQLGANPNKSFTYAKAGDGSPRLLVTDTVTYNSSNYGYGHIFYKTPFSDYILRAQFHFPSKTSFASGQGSWTIQNNGLMLHCQDPATMAVSKDYPNCVENQLLGYWSQASVAPPNSRSSNVCTPGVTINYNGSWYSDGSGHHCTNAKAHSLAYDSSVTTVKGGNSTNTDWPGKDVWQYAMARVIDSASMTFWVRNTPADPWDSVMGFTRIHLGNAPSTSNLGSATPLMQGYIALQMEGTTTEFAKIELLNLKGCMTPTDLNYKTYFVRHDSTECGKPAAIPRAELERVRSLFALSGDRLTAPGGILRVEARDVRGRLVATLEGGGALSLDLSVLEPGAYSLTIRTAKGSGRAAYVRF